MKIIFVSHIVINRSDFRFHGVTVQYLHEPKSGRLGFAIAVLLFQSFLFIARPLNKCHTASSDLTRVSLLGWLVYWQKSRSVQVRNVERSRYIAETGKTSMDIPDESTRVWIKFLPIADTYRSNRLALTSPEEASFVFYDCFKISLPHPYTMASLKFGQPEFPIFFSNL